MSEESKSSVFIQNLPKIYGIYTGGFIAFILLMAIFEQFGMGADTIGILFVAFTVFIYAGIGWLSRTVQIDAYYVAGRQVPAVFNGMATAADWMSGASFVAMAGGIYFGGHGYLAFVVGWTGGYVLVASLMAPYLRKFGCYPVPDYIGTRYGGTLARLCAVVVLVVASFTYVTAQINATGTIASRALQIPFEVGVWFGLLGILLCSMLGGMRAVTWTQVAQYIVLIIAYLVPVFWMSNKQGFGLIPQFAYGDAVQRVMELEALHQVGTLVPTEKFAGLAALTKPHVDAGTGMAAWKFVTLVFCMMTGTASLPHILMRYFTTPSVKAARQSVAWSLLFIFLLYFTAPALATFTKLQVLDPNLATGIIGKSFAEVEAITWIQKWSSVGFLAISDSNGDGILQINEFFMRGDIVVLATPEIAGLPAVISGLVAAGGMAAAMSTADGLLLAIANALSHDLYYKMIDPNASTVRRLAVSKALLLVVALLAAYVTSLKPGNILFLVGAAFSLAASGFFPALVCGVFWKRANYLGAVLGMVAGLGVCMYYMVLTYPFFGCVGAQCTANQWWDIAPIAAGTFGVPAGFLGVIIGSLISPAPSKEIQELVDHVRYPSLEGDIDTRGA